MAKKARRAPNSQEQKKARSILIKKGLYKPKNPRGPLTDYAKKLLRKFSDVTAGKASVVTAKAEKKGNKGFKEARAANTGENRPGTVRTVRNKIIVPTQTGEQARYSKKEGVRVTRRVGNDVYVRRPFKRRPRSIAGVRSQLKEGDYIAVPLYRARSRGVEWTRMSPEDFTAFLTQYGPKATKREYENLLDYIEISSIEQPKRERRII